MVKLGSVLAGIDWSANIKASLGGGSAQSEIDEVARRVAIWSMQLEQADSGNPALSFVREMQHSIQHCGALIGLCLYKPSAAASRTLVESCMHYTYFRTHHEELATLLTNSKYHMSKSDIIEYHKMHSLGFKTLQDALGLVGRLEVWYSQTSSIIHGQIPGTWNTNASLADTGYNQPIQDLAVKTLVDGVAIVNDLLLCTVAQRLWTSFAPDAKTFIMKGVPSLIRTVLGFDTK